MDGARFQERLLAAMQELGVSSVGRYSPSVFNVKVRGGHVP